GFDESFDACEDVEFNHRAAKAGLRCWFTPRAGVHYHPRATLGGLFRQMTRYGRGRVRLLRKHPDTLSPGTLVPAAFVLFVLLGAVAALTHPWVALAYGVTMGLYAALVLAVSTALAWRKRELALLPVLALVFLTVHVGAGVGLLWEALLGAWSSRKQAQQ